MLKDAHLIKRLSSSASPIVYVSAPQLGLRIMDDPSRRCPDIAKARRVLGWEPHVPLAEGLEKTIAWFRQVV